MGKNKAANYTVAIYAGHGKSTDGTWDAGCVYKNYTEAELVLPITNSAVVALKRCGFNVLTDSSANKINMLEQVAKSNANNADIHVALHLDWSKAPKGTFPICASNEGEKLSSAINKTVMKRTGMTTRGIKKTDEYYETNATKMPAVIFECGSIKNDLARVKKHEIYGEAVAEGICNYFDVPYVVKSFKVKTKKKLIIRKGASLLSAKTGTTEKGQVYTIVDVSKNGQRGKLKSGIGWITITEKYCSRV